MSISVIMPNYNHGKYLHQSLPAILGQSYPPSEIVIVDDGSLDESVAIIKEYQKDHPTIKLFQHAKNEGAVPTMNDACKRISGDYIAMCAVDDQIYPTFFEETITLLNKYPKAALCTTNFSFFYEDGVPISTFNPHLQSPSFLSPQELVLAIRKFNFWIPTNASLFRKDYLFEAGLFKEELGALADWFLCLVAAFRHGVCHLPKNLTAFRMNEHSYSHQTKQKQWYGPLMQLLESKEYADVRDAFLDSGIFFQLDREMILYLFSKSRYRSYVPRVLVQKIKQKLQKQKRILQVR